MKTGKACLSCTPALFHNYEDNSSLGFSFFGCEGKWLSSISKTFLCYSPTSIAQQKEVPSPILLIQTPTEKHIIRKHYFRHSSFFFFLIWSSPDWNAAQIIPSLSLNSANEKALGIFSSLWMGREQPVLFLLVDKQGGWIGHHNPRLDQRFITDRTKVK